MKTAKSIVHGARSQISRSAHSALCALPFALCALLYAPGATAGWNTNAWPAHEHLRAGATNIQDLHDSLRERYESGTNWFTAPTTPRFYRFNRSLLVDYKGTVMAMLATNGHRGWLDTHTQPAGPAGGSAVTNLTPIRLAEICRLPTNYLSYTPWRCLDGVGPFTNDLSVGRGYGWTNEYTAAGGTNYPPGRTNWYTTDYGYDGLRLMVTNMTAYWYDNYERYSSWQTWLAWIGKRSDNVNLRDDGYLYGEGATQLDAANDFATNYDDWSDIAINSGFAWRESVSVDITWYPASGYYKSLHPYRYVFACRPTAVMSSLASTSMLSRIDIYAYSPQYLGNVCNVEASRLWDGASPVKYYFWESITPGTNTYLTGSNFFGTVSVTELMTQTNTFGWNQQVYSQGALLWFNFNHK
jgi:hypothetical protein